MSGEDATFFEQMATCREAYRRLADCILDVCGVSDRVLDIGCGLGAVIDRLRERGVGDVWGWDSEEACRHASESIRSRLSSADLTDPELKAGTIGGLLICTETGEHLPAEHADNLVRLVTEGRPDRLVWSAAPPGQEWPGHINLQPPEYWLRRLETRGYIVDWDRTHMLRSLMRSRHAQHEFCADNFHVLEPGKRSNETIAVILCCYKHKQAIFLLEAIDSQVAENAVDWGHLHGQRRRNSRQIA